jgi:hypothetical protein
LVNNESLIRPFNESTPSKYSGLCAGVLSLKGRIRDSFFTNTSKNGSKTRVLSCESGPFPWKNLRVFLFTKFFVKNSLEKNIT